LTPTNDTDGPTTQGGCNAVIGPAPTHAVHLRCTVFHQSCLLITRPLVLPCFGMPALGSHAASIGNLFVYSCLRVLLFLVAVARLVSTLPCQPGYSPPWPIRPRGLPRCRDDRCLPQGWFVHLSAPRKQKIPCHGQLPLPRLGTLSLCLPTTFVLLRVERSGSSLMSSLMLVVICRSHAVAW